MEKKTILVTGGAGFIGSYTVKRLLSLGYKVRVFDNLSTGKIDNLPIDENSLQFIEGDIQEIEKHSLIFDDVDSVYHFAAQTSVNYSMNNPDDSFNINVIGAFKVLDQIRKRNIQKIIFSSSAAVYGDNQNLPLSEVEMLKPLSPYALEKVTVENYIKLYSAIYGINYVILRYFNVYGIGQDPSSEYSGVISKLINQYIANKSFTIYGDGTQSRDFIHVSDVVSANVLALDNVANNNIYNIATGNTSTINQLIATLEKKNKTKMKISYATRRAGDIKHSQADISLARNKLGFTPSKDISAIQQMI